MGWHGVVNATTGQQDVTYYQFDGDNMNYEICS